MDFSLSDHQKLIRDTVRQFMEAEVRPSVTQRDRQEKFPAAEIRKLAALGCCGMIVHGAWGGPGLDTCSYVLMLEEVARIDAAMATALSVTNSAVQIPLLNFGSDAQKKKYLQRLATGEILGAFCLTEAQAGSDAAAIQARATRDGNAAVYKLQGTKTWVHHRQRRRSLHRLCKDRPRRWREGHHRLPRRAEFSRLLRRTPRGKNGPALLAVRRSYSERL